eukprot:766321-Hanusia_phi.AAC.4
MGCNQSLDIILNRSGFYSAYDDKKFRAELRRRGFEYSHSYTDADINSEFFNFEIVFMSLMQFICRFEWNYAAISLEPCTLLGEQLHAEIIRVLLMLV